MLQNLDLNIPVKRENTDTDPAGQDFASHGSCLIQAKGSLTGAQSAYKYRK